MSIDTSTEVILDSRTVASSATTSTCTIKLLPEEQRVAAAAYAVSINPTNAPATQMLQHAFGQVLPVEHIAVLTTKYWGAAGVHLTVGFLDNPPADLMARLLSHMNAWGRTANVSFVASNVNPQVRIARTAGGPTGGYWSYIGTDINSIAAGQATMNLDSFTMNTADSEFYRVVRHETGHTLGYPHEHTRSEIVNRIDPAKAIAFFGAPPNSWSAAKTTAQVLTPLNNSALIATQLADTHSIMCYWLPASIMKDNVAVTGGGDIDFSDASFAESVYPKTAQSSKAAPAITAFNGKLVDAFVANNNTNTLIACTSADGLVWSGNTSMGQASQTAPSLTTFNGHLWAGFIANNNGNTVLVCSSSDGVHWGANVNINQASKFAPALAAFNGHLWACFVANNNSDSLIICSSADGTHWTNNTPLNQSSHNAPALAVFNGRLWCCFVANNNTNTIVICSSADGINWTNNTTLSQASKTAPTLTVFNNRLWVAFVANNNTNTVLVCSSADGAHWTGNTALRESSCDAPSLTAYNGQLWMSFLANNGGRAVLTCSSPDGVVWARNIII